MTRHQNLALFATIIGSGGVLLDGSAVNLALPRTASELPVGFDAPQWTDRPADF